MLHYTTKYSRGGGGGRSDSAAYHPSHSSSRPLPPSPYPLPPSPSPPSSSTSSHTQTEAKSARPQQLHTISTAWSKSTGLGDAFCPREELATELWRAAKRHRLLHIRGSPASGKTTLRKILSAHININDPDYKVFTLIGWERREVKEAGGFVGTLESATKMPYLELATEASKVVILFDEAQDSYWDEELWLEFFKALELGMGSIVILFASFGADQRTPVGTINTGTPLVMMPQMRIGLYPSAGSRVGLLMGENEAKELVTRKFAVMSSHEMVVDERLMRYLYLITDGHCGALSSLSEELYDAFQGEARRDPNISYDDGLEKLFAEPLRLAKNLESSKFGRGLYADQNTAANNVLEMILRTGSTTDERCRLARATGFDLLTGLYELHWRGMIYTFKQIDGQETFIFPSTLYRWYYSTRLAWDGLTSWTMLYNDVVLLSFNVIKNFSPSQPLSSRCGPGGVPHRKEATYHFEMYRVLHEILGGRLYATPEFGKDLDSRSVDLQITGVDWGIECMFEGRKLKDYVEEPGRAYRNWCQQYIMLDFRTTRLAKAHDEKGYEMLYHVVFNPSHTVVEIYHAANIKDPVRAFRLVY